MKRRFVIFLLALIVPLLAYSKAGDLDPTFGEEGIAAVNFLGNESGRSVAVQPDGKILVAGEYLNGPLPDFAVARYNADGSVDRSFGNDGFRTTDFGHYDVATAIAVQPDGKIVLAGFSYKGMSVFAIARYLPNGDPDNSFDGDGKVVTSIGPHDAAAATAVAIRPDGKLLVAGYAKMDHSNPLSPGEIFTNYDFVVARYTAAGKLDTTFGAGGTGIVTYPVSSKYDDKANAIDVDVHDKIVLAGYSSNGSDSDVAVVRLNSDGKSDMSFGPLDIGSVTAGFPGNQEAAFAVTHDSDGRILAAGNGGSGGQSFALFRFDAGGNGFDSSFGDDGLAEIPTFGGSKAVATAVALDGKERILAAGTVVGANTNFALARYLPDGSLDTNFGSGGQATADLKNGNEEGMDMALLEDGRILVAGTTRQGAEVNFALARFIADSADLAVVKSDSPDPVEVGGTLTYTLEVTNNGPDPVSNASVNDSLPGGVTFLSASTSLGVCGTFFAIPLPGLQVKCPLGTLAAGQKATATIQVKPTAPGVLTNTATVSVSDLFDPVDSNNSVQITTTVLAPGEAPPPPPPPGDEGPTPEGETTVPSGGGDVATPPEEPTTPPEEKKTGFTGRAMGGGGLFNCSLDPRAKIR
jgi:uncharacterized delta-60 repeat protein/uncharacterized repeat protein (TIGR01451 family)